MASIVAMHAGRFSGLIAIASFVCTPGCALVLDFDRFEGGGEMDGGRDASVDAEMRVDGCTPSGDELCNDADDDCDGTADEAPTECSVANGTTACVAGACGFGECNDGFADCDDAPLTCEARLDARDHCGDCDARCGATEACTDSDCREIMQEWAVYLEGTTAGYLNVGNIAVFDGAVLGTGTIVGPSLRVGTTALPSPSANTDFWTAVFRASDVGAVQWARVIRGTGSIDVQGVVGDAAGNGYIGGRAGAGALIYGDADSGSVLRNETAGNGFVMSVDPTGNMRWGHHVGQAGGVRALAIGPTGDHWVTGDYQGELRIDATNYPERNRANGAFLMRQRSNGAIAWVVDWAATDQPADRVAVDAENNAYVMGVLGSAFVVHAVDADGAPRWNVRFDAPNGFTGGAAIAVSEGVVLVHGSASGDVSFGETLMDAPFLAALNAADGTLRWWRTDEITTYRIASVPGGFVRAGTTLLEALDFGYGVLAGPGARDAVVERMALDGSHVWAALFGSPQFDEAYDVAIAPDGAVYVGGRTSDNMTFAGMTHTETGGTDGFVVRLRP